MIFIGYLIVAFLVIIDQLSKWVILDMIKIGNVVTIIPGIIDFRPVYNTGAAFSMFNEYTWILGLISLTAVIFISFFMKDINFKTKTLFSISLVLIFSGTFGNMIDRLFNQKGVFDFVEFTFVNFAIFNFADTCLTIGFVLLAIDIIFLERRRNNYGKN